MVEAKAIFDNGDTHISENGNSESAEIVVNPVDSTLEAWIAANAVEITESRVIRTAQSMNRVVFKSGKNGLVKVTRLLPETVKTVNTANSLNVVNPPVFERVFIADFSTVYNGERLGKRLGAIGITATKQAYLLTSGGKPAIKTNSGENQTVLNNMVATVQKAINLATKHGLYDEFTFVYDESDVANKPEQTFVSTEVTL